MTQIEFLYQGRNTIIQCNINEKMKDIIKKYIIKEGIDKNSIYFLYSGNKINEELILKEIIGKNNDINKIKILVNKIENLEDKDKIIKSNNIICPICGEISLINIKDYLINIYGCKNKHIINNILFNKFENTQNINISKIICDKCKEYNKGNTSENKFYRCNKCEMNLCIICKIKHDKNHIIIDYDDKDYICNKHNEGYIRYCNECKINICLSCEPEHINHNTISIMPDINKLRKEINELKEKINIFTNNIYNLIKKLKKIIENINIYYKIYENIINKYENKKRNYELLKNINEINNNDIIKDINEINNNFDNKLNNIMEIYNKMNNNEINIIYNINNNKDCDEEEEEEEDCEKNSVKIFGSEFVKNNKNNCKIIYENEEYELKEYINIKDNKKEKIELKLKGINNITNMSCLFHKCNSLSSLTDLSKWDTSNIINMSYIFYQCDLLKFLPDISKWNISNVKYIQGMFTGCQNLKSLPDISEWDTSNVIYMGGYFKDLSSLIPLSNKEIKEYKENKKEYIRIGMFYKCNSLSVLPDISKWNTSNVTNMSGMFYSCKDSLNIPEKFKK